MKENGIIRSIHSIKKAIWMLVGLFSIILLLKAYIKMASKFIVHIVTLLVGVIGFFVLYKKQKRIKHYLSEVSQAMCDKLKSF